MTRLERKILIGDVIEQLKKIPSESVDTVISSPPYWGLRDYGEEGQWGLEKDFHDYLDKLDAMMNECWRVLKPTGSCWINLGDTYSTISGGMKDLKSGRTKQYGKVNYTDNGKESAYSVDQLKMYKGLQSKSRVGIPERFYIRCIDNGWVARNHIPWIKANSMPSSVRDRFTNKWESVFFFVKQKKYYFNLDAVRETPKSGFDKKPFNRRIRDAKRLKQQGLDGVIVGANMSDKEESTTDKNGNRKNKFCNPDSEAVEFSRSKGSGGNYDNDGINSSVERNKEIREKTALIGKNPGDVFRQEMEKQEKEVYGKDDMKNARRSRVMAFFNTEGRNGNCNPLGKNPGDVFRIKVSEIEETTIGEPLEDRKYAKVERATMLGQRKSLNERMNKARELGSDHDAGLNNPKGKNPGDIFEINTRPFAKAHFATFPPALPEKILKCACPKQVCKKCGQPREEITEVVGNVVTENMRIAGCNKDGKYFGKGQKDYKPSKAENPSDAKRRILESMSKVKKVIGYKECDCKAGFEAGTVLDPFFGAGTVAIVAEEQRLNWIGIELKKEYADIATERLKPYMEQEKL